LFTSLHALQLFEIDYQCSTDELIEENSEEEPGTTSKEIGVYCNQLGSLKHILLKWHTLIPMIPPLLTFADPEVY
jgi:hypothetical protein